MAGNLSSNNTGRSNRRRRSFRPTSDINVTPLVDVMLVLLIVFMVTAPMLTVGVPVDLPKTQAAQMNDQVEPLVVSIDVNGKTYFQENELPLPDILKKLTEASDGKPDTKIYVRGDKKLPYGQIMETMGAIAAAGFSRVSLIAELPMPNHAAPKVEHQKQEKPMTPAVTTSQKTTVERPKLLIPKATPPAAASNRTRPPL
ncbi:MAG: protein TolR [Pseudomonadota bacterium]